jgi:predicted negative regulator of RcsB-dependent stress response
MVSGTKRDRSINSTEQQHERQLEQSNIEHVRDFISNNKKTVFIVSVLCIVSAIRIIFF